MVYVRKGAKGPLAPPYSGPYKVLRKGPKVFHIEVGGVEQIVTVDRLKPHSGAATADPAAPPKRGHPRPLERPRPPRRPRQRLGSRGGQGSRRQQGTRSQNRQKPHQRPESSPQVSQQLQVPGRQERGVGQAL